MRCQDVERLILEASERELSAEDELAVEQHLAKCVGCAGFAGFWKELHAASQEQALPKLAPQLEERVRLRCRVELKAELKSRLRPEPLPPLYPAPSRPSAPVPWPVWAALAVLTVLTLSFLIPGIEEFLQEQKFSALSILLFVLLLQNALALFFIPLLMRQRRFHGEVFLANEREISG